SRAAAPATTPAAPPTAVREPAAAAAAPRATTGAPVAADVKLAGVVTASVRTDPVAAVARPVEDVPERVAPRTTAAVKQLVDGR
ncbi:MAG: hypothetical protein JWP56_3060, partial [Aeromicrobium sp.]|nr:hypothetical protein [Aeromicrobium sp.]